MEDTKHKSAQVSLAETHRQRQATAIPLCMGLLRNRVEAPPHSPGQGKEDSLELCAAQFCLVLISKAHAREDYSTISSAFKLIACDML